MRARVASLGAAGDAWHRALPGVLAELEQAWDVEVDRALPGGSASYVARARTADGQERVVKVLLPTRDPDPADEARALAAAGGRGHALLHAHDPDRRALLLESLGGSLEHTPRPPEDKLALLADTLRIAWTTPLDSAPEVLPGVDVASRRYRLIRELDRRHGHPVAREALALALRYAERRAAAYDPDRCVVAHGDAHPANLLRANADRPGAETGWVFVDPDGRRAEPAYDLGVCLRDWTGRLRAAGDGDGGGPRRLLEGYAGLLAARTGVAEQEIWEWGFVERVATGLYVLDFGGTAIGRRLLDSAARLC